MSGKENCVRSFRGLGKEENAHGRFLFAIKTLLGGLGREEECWAARWHCGVLSYFEKCTRRRIFVRECVLDWEDPCGWGPQLVTDPYVQVTPVWYRWRCCCPEEFPRTESQDHLGQKTPPRSWSAAVRTAQDECFREHRIDCLRVSEVMLTSFVCSSNKTHLFYLKSNFQRKKNINKILLTLILVWKLTLLFQQGLLKFSVKHNLKSWVKMWLGRVRCRWSCSDYAKVKLLFPLVSLGGRYLSRSTPHSLDVSGLMFQG